MNARNSRSGYIMIFTLIMISLLTALVTYLANRSIPYISLSATVVERERAKEIALGGIQMGLSQLAWAAADTKEKKEQPTDEKKGEQNKTLEQDERFLEKILPRLNRWNSVKLTKKNDGIDAQIHFAIMCEDGKLNINEIYDFQKHAFIGKGGNPQEDYEKLMEAFFKELEKKSGGKELFKSFAAFLKNRTYKINDVTELLTIKAFEPFKNKLFYEPPRIAKKEAESQEKKQATIYLTDIFTVYSQEKLIQPWLLSNSMCALLNLETSHSGDIEKRTKSIKKWVEDFKQDAKWDRDWDKELSSVYGKKFNIVPKFIKPLLATRFGPTVFSVLSYGRVGEVTQRFLAIVEKGKPSQEQDGRADVTIRKLYWL